MDIFARHKMSKKTSCSIRHLCCILTSQYCCILVFYLDVHLIHHFTFTSKYLSSIMIFAFSLSCWIEKSEHFKVTCVRKSEIDFSFLWIIVLFFKWNKPGFVGSLMRYGAAQRRSRQEFRRQTENDQEKFLFIYLCF